MLVITDNAAEAIRGIVATPGVPDGAGLRIAIQEASAQPGVLEVSVAAEPEDSDQVVDESGARVFLEQRVVELLDDKQLDAQVEGASVGFTLSEQEDAL